MKYYQIKEIFLTLQGEGANSGRRAVFCRFTACNLWSGVESDRLTAVCRFCDTAFVGTDGQNGGRYHAVALAAKIAEVWDSTHTPRFVVLTGGEPMLQVDDWLIDVLHRWDCELAIETNGTKPVPPTMDWVTVSPKAGAELVHVAGDELKLVYPQEGAEPEKYAGLNFREFFLSPMDGPDLQQNTQAALAYCLAHPQWRLNVQMHKVVGIQ